MRNGFQARFDQWLSDWQTMLDQHAATKYPGKENMRRVLTAERLQKRMRVWCKYASDANPDGRGNCYAFVDLETGDILKPASWKAPAKHARGNIFDEQHGLGAVHVFGVNYLR